MAVIASLCLFVAMCSSRQSFFNLVLGSAEKKILFVLGILGIKLLADQTVLTFSFDVNEPPHLYFRAIGQILIKDKAVIKHLLLFGCFDACSFFLRHTQAVTLFAENVVMNFLRLLFFSETVRDITL